MTAFKTTYYIAQFLPSTASSSDRVKTIYKKTQFNLIISLKLLVNNISHIQQCLQNVGNTHNRNIVTKLVNFYLYVSTVLIVPQY